jgi:hypothetical protein
MFLAIALLLQCILALPNGWGALATVAVSVPWALSFSDELRTRNMTYVHPAENETIKAGQEYRMETLNFGLSSRYHARTTKIYLLHDGNLTSVIDGPIAKMVEWDFLSNVQTTSYVVPSWSDGIAKLQIPAVADGSYRIRYASAWTVWEKSSSFMAISPRFYIKS